MILCLVSCNEGCYELSSLRNERVSFNKLPQDIIQYLKNSVEYQIDIQNMLVELPKNKNTNYRLETVNTFIGPWVAYQKLVDNEKNIYYKIEQGVPSPYIVFENKLYIPDRYNIFTTVDDLDSLKFIRYESK